MYEKFSRWAYRQRDGQTYRNLIDNLKHVDKLIDRQTVGQTDRQQTKGGQIDERTDRAADEQTET
jgi:hypothetical protein